MKRSYIEWCKLLNKLSHHSYQATSPAEWAYWQNHRDRLSNLLQAQGWRL